jgi:hypothetical protein
MGRRSSLFPIRMEVQAAHLDSSDKHSRRSYHYLVGVEVQAAYLALFDTSPAYYLGCLNPALTGLMSGPQPLLAWIEEEPQVFLWCLLE